MEVAAGAEDATEETAWTFVWAGAAAEEAGAEEESPDEPEPEEPEEPEPPPTVKSMQDS